MNEILLGERLLKLRKRKNWSQYEIADMLEMPRSTYAQYESSKRQPDYTTLKKIAVFYKISIDYLLGYSEETTIDNEKSDPLYDLEFLEGEELYFSDYKKLSDEDKLAIVKHIKALLNMSKKK